jgi:hypothetical protein
MEMMVSPVLLGLPEFNVPVDFSITTSLKSGRERTVFSYQVSHFQIFKVGERTPLLSV